MKAKVGIAKASEDTRAVKRSISVRRDLDDAILGVVGSREYSSFVNEAVILALQARGINDSVAEFERQHGPLTAKEKSAARDRRSAAARG